MLSTFFLAQAAGLPGVAPVQRPQPHTNRPPRIEVELPAGRLRRDDSVRFRVRVVDPEGRRVSLRLRNPPPGMVFDPLLLADSPATVEARWWITNRGGPNTFERLEFEAEDERGALARETVEVPLHSWWRIREFGTNAYELGDVTGDGVLDVVGVATAASVPGNPDAGGVYVWSGTLAPGGAPTATLHGSGALAPWGLGRELALVDVSGDGVLDVVAGAGTKSGTPAGGVFVWKGGAGLVGQPAPSALLHDPAGEVGDFIHDVHFLDVDGDGQRDVVASSELTDGILDNEGALYVWRGGPTLTGELAPAIKYFPTQDGETYFFMAAYGDVSGDGVVDLIGGRRSDVGSGTAPFGGLYVWFGGPDFAESALPDATLTIPSVGDGSHVGDIPPLLVDLTGDGVLDIVCGTPDIDLTVNDVGALFFWEGGENLHGTRAPGAMLAVPGASIGDRLGESFFGNGATVRSGDVTGDGRDDLVVSAMMADKKILNPQSRVVDAGAVYVWAGRSEFAGTVAPSASLFDPAARAGDKLTETRNDETGFVLDDVTGDGIADIVVMAALADLGAFADEGKVLVWAGGAGLVGSPAPRAVLHGPMDGSTDGLGSAPPEIGDLTGDGVVELVVGTQEGHGGTYFVWSGGAALSGEPAPLARLEDPTVLDGSFPFAGGRGVFLADVTGDGKLDVVAGTPAADPEGREGAGAVLVWAGGASLAGTQAPLARFYDPSGLAGDQLCGSVEVGQALQLGDVDRDGVLDVIAAASWSDPNGIVDAGAAFVWRGGATMTGAPAPRKLVRGAARTGDVLGDVRGQGLRLAQLGTPRTLDLLLCGWRLDVNGLVDRGAILCWEGPIVSSGAETIELGVPNGSGGDRLGR